MKCFDIDHLGNVKEGIEVRMDPEPHVRLAWMIWQAGTAIGIVSGTIISWEPTFGPGYDRRSGHYKRAVKKDEKHLLKRAGVVRDGAGRGSALPGWTKATGS